jgi:hypothetical protein
MVPDDGEGEQPAVSPLHKKPEMPEGIDSITQSGISRFEPIFWKHKMGSRWFAGLPLLLL